jgi:threonine/homoserine/homoserine lactone efflux protein
MSLLFIFTTAYAVALSGALVPGPLLTVAIKESLQQGWRSGFLISAGHGLAEIALLVLFALGLDRLLHAQWISIWITVLIGIVGGLVLLYLGVDTGRSACNGLVALDLAGTGDIGTGDMVSGRPATPASALSPLKSGLVASIANPYWVLWWFTIGMLYVTQALQFGLLGLGSFYAGHILADASWYMFVAIAVATGKRWMSPAAYRIILGVCSLFLMLLAVYFIYRGIRAAALL